MSGTDSNPTHLERFRQLIHNRQKLAPIAKHVDAHVESVDPGRVRVRYAVKPEFMHPGNAVQGGIVTAYADMAMAAHTLCADGQFLATSQLSIGELPYLTNPGRYRIFTSAGST
ncbi:MAG: PaaI family thioesterase [Candidatus Rokubacteria bacterium]|nr:PaaI family thioesterase [Candidatus Rokubacteria bacterium]